VPSNLPKPGSNLTPQQAKSAETISSSGGDLLALINDILDLSKIESGTVSIDVADAPFRALREFTERTFRHLARNKGLEFAIEMDGALPRSHRDRFQAFAAGAEEPAVECFKFTEKGRVRLRIAPATEAGAALTTG